jgi:hypothetical protein
VRRLRLLLLIAIAVVVFLAISAVLARVLSVDGAERGAVTALVRDEARGDAAAMVADMYDCRSSAACRQRAALDAAALTRPGALQILEIDPSAGFSLGSTLGTARVAWRAGSSLPIVQCVRVRRAGNALTGLRVELLKISVRIRSGSNCPARY